MILLKFDNFIYSLLKTVKKEHHIILIKNEQELSYDQFDSAWTHFLVIVCPQEVATRFTNLNVNDIRQ